MDIEAEAKRLYMNLPGSKPDWDQLGDITKSVWRERAQAQHQQVPPLAALEVEVPHQPPNQDEQIGLF